MSVNEAHALDTARADRMRVLFEATNAPLLRYALRRTRGGSDAEDAVAETFLIAWRRLSDVPPPDSELPWLYGVCRRVVANQRRGRERRVRLLERAASMFRPPETGLDEPSGVGIDALRRLRPDDQEILTLVAWEGLSHAEIAQVMGLSQNAVAIRLHRARQRFLNALDDGSLAPRLGRRLAARMTLKGTATSRTSRETKAAVDDGPELEHGT